MEYIVAIIWDLKPIERNGGSRGKIHKVRGIR